MGGFSFAITFIPVMLLGQFLLILSDVWLGFWSGQRFVGYRFTLAHVLIYFVVFRLLFDFFLSVLNTSTLTITAISGTWIIMP